MREPAMAAALVRRGAGVDTRETECGDTLLIRAARSGNAAILAALLAAYASIDARNLRGETALDAAIEGGNEEVVALLRAAQAASDAIPVERAR